MAGIHSFLTAASKGEIALSKLTVAVKKEIEIAVSKLKLPWHFWATVEFIHED